MVNDVSSYYDSSSAYSTNTLNKELDRNAFMSLLVVQMQNQDPMKPMEDTEFIAQLAQFSSLEQMEQLNQQIAVMNANNYNTALTGMIGREVTYQDPTAADTVTGKVTGVKFADGTPLLIIDGKEVSPSWITKVE